MARAWIVFRHVSEEGNIKPRRPELSAVLRRYGRRASSARRAAPPPLEVWQRVVDSVARTPSRKQPPRPPTGPVPQAPPAVADGVDPGSEPAAPPLAGLRVRESQPTLDALAEAAAVAEAAASGDLQVEAEPERPFAADAGARGSAAAAPAAPDQPRGMADGFLAEAMQRDIELITPGGASLGLVGDVVLENDGVVRVVLDRAPANDPALLTALTALAAGAALSRPAPPATSRAEGGGGGPLSQSPTSEHVPVTAAAATSGDLQTPTARGPKRGGAAARLLDRPLRRPPEVLAPSGPPPSLAALLGGRAGAPVPAQARAAPWIGVDLGSLNARAAVVCGADVEPIVDERGLPSIPALISFPSAGEVLVGQQVAARLLREARWTVAPRRLLGRSADETERAAASSDSALRVFVGDGGVTCLDAHGAVYSGTELCALVLSQVRAAARRRVGGNVSAAVFAVPVGFDARQRAALRAAAEQAGLEVKAMITEPSAALLGCGLRRPGGHAAFFSLGATFSFSVVELGETSFHVVAAGGDLTLGGEVVDCGLAELLAERCVAAHEADPREDVETWDRLLWSCSAAKEVLSIREAVDVGFPPRRDAGPERFRVTREDLWPVLDPLIARALALADELLERSALQPAGLDALVLGGGLCRIPAVQQAVGEHFALSPAGGATDLAVARGAAQRASELAAAPPAPAVATATPRTLGLSIAGEVKPLALPAEPEGGPARQRVITERDGQTEIVVAICEAVPGAGWHVLGQLRYAGLPPRPAGEAVVELSVWRESPQALRIVAVVSGRRYETRFALE